MIRDRGAAHSHLAPCRARVAARRATVVATVLVATVVVATVTITTKVVATVLPARAATVRRADAKAPSAPKPTKVARPAHPTTPSSTSALPTTAGRHKLNITVNATRVLTTIVVPKGFKSGQRSPVLLAFPPGGQDDSLVEVGLDKYWAEGARRGWIVISVAAPNGELFFQGSELLIPSLLDQLASTYPPEGGRIHIGGISNGGLSAFRVVLAHPERYASLVTLPGQPYDTSDNDRVPLLAKEKIPVFLGVGELDTVWREGSEKTAAALNKAGGKATLVISPGDGHFISHIAPATVWAFLEAARRR